MTLQWWISRIQSVIYPWLYFNSWKLSIYVVCKYLIINEYICIFINIWQCSLILLLQTLYPTGGADSATSGGKDNATVRHYSQFLVELAELVPQALVPSLPLLFTFLDNENYSLRNCMLSMMGSLVMRVLSREDLDEKSRDLRDNCLDCIEDHVMDVNAFVRSKVSQFYPWSLVGIEMLTILIVSLLDAFGVQLQQFVGNLFTVFKCDGVDSFDANYFYSTATN